MSDDFDGDPMAKYVENMPPELARVFQLWSKAIVRAERAEAILTGLLADLRERHQQVVCPCGCGWGYDSCECGDEWPCDEVESEITRAEARLREVGGDE